MRILFTIPHYYNPQGGGFYGSLKAGPAPRRNALASMVFGLHCTLGARQGLMASPIAQANTTEPATVDVVICTTGEQHLVRELGPIAGLFRHHATRAEPKYLGFECHEVLREGLGRYDWFCYLEDDLLVTDPLFMRKLEWFNGI